MRIWAYHPTLQPAIDALHDFGVNPIRDLYHGYHAQDRYGRDAYGQYRRRTLVAEDDGQVIGVATAAATILEPKRDFAVIEVAEDHRRQGVGRALFDAVSRLRGKPLWSTVWESEPAGSGFAESLSARVRAVHLVPIVGPTSAEIATWIAANPYVGLRTDDLLKVREHSISQAYVDIHMWIDRDGNYTRSEAHLSLGMLARCLNRSASVFTYHGDRLVAAAFVFQVAGWNEIISETIRPGEPDGHRVLAATVAESLRRLGAAGVARVAVTGFQHLPHLAPILAELPAVSPMRGSLIEVPAPVHARRKSIVNRLRPSKQYPTLVMQ